MPPSLSTIHIHSDVFFESHNFGVTHSLMSEVSEGATPILMIAFGVSSCYATKILGSYWLFNMYICPAILPTGYIRLM